MKRIALMDADNRNFLFELTANKMGINPVIIEKDAPNISDILISLEELESIINNSLIYN